ncbi:alpha-1,3-galactosyltransferase 2-like isoform X2 [Petromyzon marinus]|uniref:Alpha-1,3-galactosyltransferase 2-like isoform X1 n=1 Tax=Petromyzon marinus TaxID=7757 RepID=A0AAJ7X7C7_PETMA|nr:alpha-1,3-galactosyltransferase 2-like isoform X1 [Petromyzon marinus]
MGGTPRSAGSRLTCYTIAKKALLVSVLLLLPYFTWNAYVVHMTYPRFYSPVAPARTDVNSLTPWLAPIVWQGTYDPSFLEDAHREKNVTVALTVFAVGKYVKFLERFLSSAEQHFMVGRHVVYHVMTERPEAVPRLELPPGRSLRVGLVDKHSRWQDISMARMQKLGELLEDIAQEAQYVFCFDVDMEFQGPFGVEALGDLVAVLHPWFYKRPRSIYSFEGRPASTAFVMPADRLYYYHAAVFGGTPASVRHLVLSCSRTISEDRDRGVEALWHDESHLNRYLAAERRPTKVLSPEYSWDSKMVPAREVRIIRLATVIKDYSKIRDNW